jgi:protein TonB
MFDDALVESGKSHALGGKRLSLPLALGLHLAVIAAFVGASAWLPGEPPEPADGQTVPIVFAPLSVPAGSGGGERRQPAHGAPPRVHHEMTQPDLSRIEPGATTVPTVSPSDAAPTADDAGAVENEPGGGPDADGGGGTRPGNGGGGGGYTEEIQPVGGDVRAPVLLERIEPDYPEAARRAHLDGTVILEATIAASGEIQQVRVLKSLNPLLDEAAVRAVRGWRYRPATLNGRAVPVFLTVTVRFGIAR